MASNDHPSADHLAEFPGAGEPLALDPQVSDFFQKFPEAAFARGDLAQLRRGYVQARLALQAAPPALAQVRDLAMPGPGGPLALRLYRPLSFEGKVLDGALPCLLYCHGGGFVLGDLESHDPLCRALATQGQCVVLAVDYRRAPEHRFPAAVEDAAAALQWAASQAAALGIDPARLAIGGDSAGGNLAAVTAITARERKLALALQLLLYPVTDLAHDLPSHTRFASGYRLTHADLLWFREQYLADAGQQADWRASPLRAPDLRGLAPAFVITAGHDPLLDEGVNYARRLHEAGVGVTHECFTGMIHGFALMTAHLAAGHHAIYRAGQALRSAFGLAQLPHAPRPPRAGRPA